MLHYLLLNHSFIVSPGLHWNGQKRQSMSMKCGYNVSWSIRDYVKCEWLSKNEMRWARSMSFLVTNSLWVHERPRKPDWWLADVGTDIQYRLEEDDSGDPGCLQCHEIDQNDTRRHEKGKQQLQCFNESSTTVPPVQESRGISRTRVARLHEAAIVLAGKERKIDSR